VKTLNLAWLMTDLQEIRAGLIWGHISSGLQADMWNWMFLNNLQVCQVLYLGFGRNYQINPTTIIFNVRVQISSPPPA
jgi:hypothetical protein